MKTQKAATTAPQSSTPAAGLSLASPSLALSTSIGTTAKLEVGTVANLPNLNLPKPKKSPKKKIKPLGPALALSGGAAHGDFEVGVVRYLYAHGLKPAIICGTSVGSINGLKLAEGEPAKPAKRDKDGHLQGLAGLIDIWESLRVNHDMYKVLDPISKFLDVLKSVATGVGAGSLVGGSVGGPVGLLLGALVGGRLEEDTLKDGIATLLATASLANFNPLETKMRKAASFKPSLVTKSKIRLRMVSTALEDGLTRLVDEKGRLLEADGTRVNSGAIYDAATRKKIADLQDRIDAIKKSFNDPDAGPMEKGQLSGIPSLEQQIAAAKRAGKVTGQKPVQVPLWQGALASSSLPVFTPPQLFNDGKNYVDGGTRMVTPIATALELGATVVYAVVASSDEIGPGTNFLTKKPLTDFLRANLVDIGLRVGSDIEPAAINDSQLMPPVGFPVPVLIFRPLHDIHASLTVAPGLIDIRMDQGWMCADDVMQAWAIDPENYLDLARQYDAERGTTWMTKVRHKIWKEEFAANGWDYLADSMGEPLDAQGVPPIPVITKNPKKAKADALARVRQMKLDLRDLVQQRLDAHGNVPPGVERWWNDWERHTWTPTETLWPLAKMKVTAKPDHGVPLDKLTTVTITARDSAGKKVKGATVYVDGKEVGAAGKITARFPSHQTKKINPKTKAPILTAAGPRVEVVADGYEPTLAPIGFDTGLV